MIFLKIQPPPDRNQLIKHGVKTSLRKKVLFRGSLGEVGRTVFGRIGHIARGLQCLQSIT